MGGRSGVEHMMTGGEKFKIRGQDIGKIIYTDIYIIKNYDKRKLKKETVKWILESFKK